MGGRRSAAQRNPLKESSVSLGDPAPGRCLLRRSHPIRSPLDPRSRDHRFVANGGRVYRFLERRCGTLGTPGHRDGIGGAEFHSVKLRASARG